MNNVYVYPKFSRIDLNLIRLGGPGLANLMFGWAHAYVFSMENGYRFLWPTWAQLKLSTITGKYGDRRLYWRIFDCPSNATNGFTKIILRIISRKYSLNDKNVDHSNFLLSRRPVIINFPFQWTQNTSFENLLKYKNQIIRQIREMRPKSFLLHKQDFIAMHVRFGDITDDGSEVMTGIRVASHVRLPICYYVQVLECVRRKFSNDMPVKVYSDATDSEISELLSIRGVSRVKKNQAIDELIEMSSATYLIASGSTFSKWSSFLGEGIVIWPPLKQAFQTKTDIQKEMEFLPGIGIRQIFTNQT